MEEGPLLPGFYRKDVILKWLFGLIAQGCDSKRVTESRDSNNA
jgi:hypothetical protein